MNENALRKIITLCVLLIMWLSLTVLLAKNLISEEIFKILALTILTIVGALSEVQVARLKAELKSEHISWFITFKLCLVFWGIAYTIFIAIAIHFATKYASHIFEILLAFIAMIALGVHISHLILWGIDWLDISGHEWIAFYIMLIFLIYVVIATKIYEIIFYILLVIILQILTAYACWRHKQ